MEWLKKNWDFAGLIAAVLCGILGIVGPHRLAAWGGWTTLVFFALIAGRYSYDRSARLQSVLERLLKPFRPSIEQKAAPPRPLAFRGLLPFHEEDAVEFGKLGRQNDAAALLPALRDPGLRVLVLRGDSGCGKTSLIRAGLLPVLHAEGWHTVEIDPETQNLEVLIETARAAQPNARLLIVADQFEERFIRNEPQLAEELSNYLHKSIESHSAKWLIGVRADFKHLVDDLVEKYDGRFETEFLRPRVGYGLRLFTVSDAERVIAELGSQVFDPGIALQVAQDLSRGGRVLPADIQFVGFEMQQRGIQTLADYRKAGGRDGIIADSIRNVIEQFPSKQRKGNARKLLSSLIDSEHGTRLPEALTTEELGARAGIVGDVETCCEPFVRQRLILRVVNPSIKTVPRYRLAHDYLVQPIYTAIGHTETDYEKVIRLLTLYTGEYTRNPQARIPPYDYKLIRRIIKKVTHDPKLDEARKLAMPIIGATRQRAWTQRAIVAASLGVASIFLPPIRTQIGSWVTRELNVGIDANQPKSQRQLVQLSTRNVVGVSASIFQYGQLPFLARVPIPEMVLLPRLAGNAGQRRIAIGRFDVTVAQFNAYRTASGLPEAPGEPDLPIVSVSLDEATGYTSWLTQITGKRFRLPTSAEWESTCRAGATDRHSPLDLDEYAWTFDNSGANRHPVGQKKPNDLGLYDMLGNVEQWVGDWDEEWQLRSARGGNYTLKAGELTCASSEDNGGQAAPAVGFRVLLDLSH